VVGREVVQSYGGQVYTASHIPGRSTTDVIRKIVMLTKKGLLE